MEGPASCKLNVSKSGSGGRSLSKKLRRQKIGRESADLAGSCSTFCTGAVADETGPTHTIWVMKSLILFSKVLFSYTEPTPSLPYLLALVTPHPCRARVNSRAPKQRNKMSRWAPGASSGRESDGDMTKQKPPRKELPS